MNRLYGIVSSLVLLTLPATLRANLACLYNSYSCQQSVDYKHWHAVPCACDCEKSHKISPGGTCTGCSHRRLFIPLNASSNISNAPDVIASVNLKALSAARKAKK